MHLQESRPIDRNALEFFHAFLYIDCLTDYHKKFQVVSMHYTNA